MTFLEGPSSTGSGVVSVTPEAFGPRNEDQSEANAAMAESNAPSRIAPGIERLRTGNAHLRAAQSAQRHGVTISHVRRRTRVNGLPHDGRTRAHAPSG
jgi:LDH2 family malate/lactate/ureidoglycolate dehydrogenase